MLSIGIQVDDVAIENVYTFPSIVLEPPATSLVSSIGTLNEFSENYTFLENESQTAVVSEPLGACIAVLILSCCEG